MIFPFNAFECTFNAFERPFRTFKCAFKTFERKFYRSIKTISSLCDKIAIENGREKHRDCPLQISRRAVPDYPIHLQSMLIKTGNHRLILILQTKVIFHALVVGRGIHKVGNHGDLPRLDRFVEQR